MQRGRVVQIKENKNSETGAYVLYWMQAAQRTVDNHALDVAIRLANERRLPVVVAFVLMPNFPEANLRHFEFMLEGMEETAATLQKMGVGFKWFVGVEGAFEKFAKQAAAVVLDKGYGRFLTALRTAFVKTLHQRTYLVDTNVVVPVEEAYSKEAYAAYAIRPSLTKQLPLYGDAFHLTEVLCRWDGVPERFSKEEIVEGHLKHLLALGRTQTFRGGEQNALNALNSFIDANLANYETLGGDPSKDATSRLSPYLHFGQLSPVTAYSRVLKSGLDSRAFVEQLVIRRELSFNFVHYNPQYDGALEAILPNWANETLGRHRLDTRDVTYTSSILEEARTHDIYWNAAQREMVRTGYMHNYMRMYWGKKIIEWMPSYEAAYAFMKAQNDKYQLDGRDPNGYAGIAWCFGKHDRPFSERAVFGKVRYMNAKGLKRKFDIDAYAFKHRE